MKKSILLFAVLVSVLLVVSSCGKTGAPNCSDEDVKSLVIQITERELRNKFLNQYIYHVFQNSPYKSFVSDSQIINSSTYADWKNAENSDDTKVRAALIDVIQQKNEEDIRSKRNAKEIVTDGNYHVNTTLIQPIMSGHFSDEEIREAERLANAITNGSPEEKEEALKKANELYKEPPKLSEQDISKAVDEIIAKMLELVDSRMSGMKIELTGIRTNGKDDSIKKCECEGELSFPNGKSGTVKYTAQYTEDGQIYVEVFGL